MYKKFPFNEGELLANCNARFQFPDETHEFLNRGMYETRDDVPIFSPFLKQLVKRCLVKKVAERADIFELAKII